MHSVEDVQKAQDYIKQNFGYDINEELSDVLKDKESSSSDSSLEEIELNKSIHKKNTKSSS